MREIKFRSWNEREQQMDFPDHIANDINAEKYQVMQYTGLKDRTGKDIYEGDIVIARYQSEPGSMIGKITYHDSSFYIGSLIMSALGEFEVVGNIWENPELMKGYTNGEK